MSGHQTRESVNTEEQCNDRNNRGNFTRNLSKETDASISKKMFFGGLFLLPWLWAVNSFYYRKQLFDSSIDPDVTRWVRKSFIGFWIVTALFISWTIIFQLHWKDYGWTNLLVKIPDDELYNGW